MSGFKNKCIYSYYSTLLDMWVEWCEKLLMGDFPDHAHTLNEALGLSSSDCRSRAKEMFRIGLLSQELTQGDTALQAMRLNNNVQSDLGYVAAVIHQASEKFGHEKFIKAESALCAFFSVIQSVAWKGYEASINTIVHRLLEVFPCPNEIGLTTWLRYLLSGLFCSVASTENDSKLSAYTDFFEHRTDSVTLSIIADKTYEVRCSMSNVEDVKKAINNRISLTGIVQQKMALFILGKETDDIPRGFLSLALIHFPEFLKACYIVERDFWEDNPFISLYDEDTSKSTKANVLNELKKISNLNDNLNEEYNNVMKNIYEGAQEALNLFRQGKRNNQGVISIEDASEIIGLCLKALRTKPFLLLAGISGTGKSRIVRELAFKSCPEFLRDADGTTPGNYCMIEVKPNWHDSSELLGYYSHISKEYQNTNFIKFLVKAMMFPDVPFFVCLDEMNLAPVEQYFAEFLSVLETRKKVGDRIRTGALVKPEYFAELQNAEGGDGYIFTQWFPEIKRNIPYNIYTNPTLAQVGLTLPDNVFIIGTVNMDDTTHQFSRKVLDRAMTIEMNGGKLSDMFGQSHNLEYLPDEDIWDINKFIPEYVTADEVIAVNPDTAEELKTKLPERLEEINEVLKDTPFVVSYRVLNELVIYTGNLLNDGMSIDEAIDEAVNQIVLMKILPRIEGDEDMFIVKGAAENRLEQLAHLVSGATKAKLEEMNNRLSTGFTRFWP